MPCRNDDPSATETHLQLTAMLLAYVLEAQGKSVPYRVQQDAGNAFCRETTNTPLLCQEIHGLTPAQKEVLMYDGRNRKARQLADWWEAHQKVDADRISAEKKAAERRQAIDSLTPEQRRVLGF